MLAHEVEAWLLVHHAAIVPNFAVLVEDRQRDEVEAALEAGRPNDVRDLMYTSVFQPWKPFLDAGHLAQALNARSREIFRQIVESYLATGEPVGSRNLARIIPMTLSPASVRNVMADLEAAGLIFSPHTSAGRLPTETGLRFFVDSMMQLGDVGQEERERIVREARPDLEPAIAVVSHRFWRERLELDPQVIGRTVVVNARPYTVVGVLPERLRSMPGLGLSPAIYLPISRSLVPDLYEPRSGHLLLVGRLRTGQSMQQGRAALGAVAERLAVSYGDKRFGSKPTVVARSAAR